MVQTTHRYWGQPSGGHAGLGGVAGMAGRLWTSVTDTLLSTEGTGDLEETVPGLADPRVFNKTLETAVHYRWARFSVWDTLGVSLSWWKVRLRTGDIGFVCFNKGPQYFSRTCQPLNGRVDGWGGNQCPWKVGMTRQVTREGQSNPHGT